ncbi:hypothetical protein FGO68_gene10022 [Halteria grandinella]|uniref:Uncharacterized protein n=1 Tax=Halteria grandinella TaxID=5974 RepID=A0A8J8T8E9_HALGN|nr:hypothetical protein FGO68_gene10022 [Halteria grandinella]
MRNPNSGFSLFISVVLNNQCQPYFLSLLQQSRGLGDCNLGAILLLLLLCAWILICYCLTVDRRQKYFIASHRHNSPFVH